MTALDRAKRYLTIPRGYGDALGGLWWSSGLDAVERRDGTTLALADELRTVLDGAAARPPVPPFPFVLNLLHLMKSGAAGFEPLHRAFAGTRGAVHRGRNVGLFIAELCRGLPRADDATADALTQALRSLRRDGSAYEPAPAPEPPLTRAEFEERIARRVLALDAAAIAHWLAHGCGPVGGGAKLVDEAEPLPARVARLIARARRRARLVGAAALVPALDAAVTLPPRGRPPHALPLGGYCDVTTRGDPERLLPSQFALDPDEFVRRFAGNELLYFKREDPHEAVRPDRLVVLDQGVRTWGSVRLALAAAALSLLRADPERCGAVRLFLTSVPGPIDLTEADTKALEDRLEASDLTPHPGECLAAALGAAEAPVPRDIVVLTHRRNLSEPAVASAAGARGPADRLFALAVDETGRAELAEWGTSGPVALRTFRVDLEAAESARPEDGRPQPHPLRARSEAAWGGDAEPVPFPFRPGLVAEPLRFGFAADGDWLVVACRDGLLHGLTLDGAPPEVLPRAFRNGAVLRHVDAVLGLDGGAVVCGRMVVPRDPAEALRVTGESHGTPVVASGASDVPAVEQFVAAHYDRATRRVALHLFSRAEGEPWWGAHPDLQCVTLRTPSGAGCALDLATLGRFPFPTPPGSALVSRATAAWDRAAKGTPPHELPVTSMWPVKEGGRSEGPFLQTLSDGVVYPRQAAKTWYAVTPLRDGRPLLAGAAVYRAQLAGDVLALAYVRANQRRLLLLRGPSGAVLGEVPHAVRTNFALSPDGRLIVRREADRTVVVSETGAPAQSVTRATQASLYDALTVELAADPFRLSVTVGGHRHTFQVTNGVLKHTPRWELPTQAAGRTGRTGTNPGPLRYDPVRFPWREAALSSDWLAAVDRLGQVLLYTRSGALVAAFLVRRERVAAWVPGGAFWGEPRLIGGPATSEAAEKIGRAILAAAGE